MKVHSRGAALTGGPTLFTTEVNSNNLMSNSCLVCEHFYKCKHRGEQNSPLAERGALGVSEVLHLLTRRVSVVLGAGDAYENRTRVTAVKGRCLNRLTNAPCKSSLQTSTFTEKIHAGSRSSHLVVFVDPPRFRTPVHVTRNTSTGYKR